MFFVLGAIGEQMRRPIVDVLQRGRRRPLRYARIHVVTAPAGSYPENLLALGRIAFDYFIMLLTVRIYGEKTNQKRNRSNAGCFQQIHRIPPLHFPRCGTLLAYRRAYRAGGLIRGQPVLPSQNVNFIPNWMFLPPSPPSPWVTVSTPALPLYWRLLANTFRAEAATRLNCG